MKKNIKNTHKIQLKKWSMNSQMAILLICLYKYKKEFMTEYPIYYTYVDTVIKDYWQWLEDKEKKGVYVYYRGDFSTWEEVTTDFIDAEYLYYNHVKNWYAVSDFFYDTATDEFKLLIETLGNVVYFGVRLAEAYDYTFRDIDSQLPSDTVDDYDNENFFATLNAAITLADNPKEEEAWQKKALQKLHKYHNVEKVGEWGPPIIKDFFDDIEV